MGRPIRLGAVAYDPKVVTIWDAIREYLNQSEPRSGSWIDYVLFSNYEAQVEALLEGFIDIAWNTNLAYVRTYHRTGGHCQALAMRDTDVDFASVVIVRADAGINSLADLIGRTFAIGSRDSGHAAILPIYYLKREGINAEGDLKLRRFDLDVGKHGDTGNSESAVLAAVASGEADAGAVGDPFWARIIEQRMVDPEKVRVLWTTPTYHHCNFTALDSFDATQGRRFVDAMLAMDYNDPAHRRILDMEGLKRWVRAGTEGYKTLFEAVEEQSLP